MSHLLLLASYKVINSFPLPPSSQPGVIKERCDPTNHDHSGEDRFSLFISWKNGYKSLFPFCTIKYGIIYSTSCSRRRWRRGVKKGVSKRCGGGGEAWDILKNKDNEGGGEALLYVTAQFNNNKTDLAERRWELGIFIFCKCF